MIFNFSRSALCTPQTKRLFLFFAAAVVRVEKKIIISATVQVSSRFQPIALPARFEMKFAFEYLNSFRKFALLSTALPARLPPITYLKKREDRLKHGISNREYISSKKRRPVNLSIYLSERKSLLWTSQKKTGLINSKSSSFHPFKGRSRQ